MSDCLSAYYRSPEKYNRLSVRVPASPAAGYFRFSSAVCYGNCAGRSAQEPNETLYDALQDAVIADGAVQLPFDPSDVINNLRCELYTSDWRNGRSHSALAFAYYLVRPFLSVGIRRHLQRFHLRGWDKLSFPRWPVDSAVDDLHRELLLLTLRSNPTERIPFIWFWPEGAPSAAIMTHDVEEERGRDFCATLMDIDDNFGIKASFQVVPEQRYEVSKHFLDSIKKRGFEVAVHDLNHDGHLYADHKQFIERAAKINAYGRQFGADGFRAGVLYRKQLWFEDLRFEYDMSVPNVAHLDPQRGGCCTVMPYFLGSILEIPVTMTQDYTLFNVLNDYSIDLWKRQADLIMRRNGLLSFIVHPDYIIGGRERTIYEALLGFLDCLRAEQDVWIATPGEINRWWRERSEMTLVQDGGAWRIEGVGKERARIGHASIEDGQLVLRPETTLKKASVTT